MTDEATGEASAKASGDEWLPWPVDPDARGVRVPFPGGTRERREGFLYLDCGAWMGDADAPDAQRDFALVCGGTAVLCEFRGQDPLEPLEGEAAEEIEALNRVLALLAGPQRCDVTVKRALRAPPRGDLRPADDAGPREVLLLLPGTRFPVLATLPDLDPNLIPDPTKATCPCHGPVVTRILYGTKQEAAVYRAIGAKISRNPNDWIFMLAESHESAAKDLARLLDRVGRHARAAAVHLVQLGPLFELWDGFQCLFHGNGRMAWVRPEILRYVPEEQMLSKWAAVTHDTRTRDAVLKMLRQPAARRTLLFAEHKHGRPPPWPEGDARPATVFERRGVMMAEERPEPIGFCEDHPPLAFVALLEQKAQLRPWRRGLAKGWRWACVAAAVGRWRLRDFAVYAMAHSQRPCLVEVEVTSDLEVTPGPLPP